MKLAVTVPSQMTMRLRGIMKEKQKLLGVILYSIHHTKKIVEYFAVFKPNNLLIMKKVLIVLVLIMAVMAVNAQVINTTDSTRTVVKVADLQKAITDNIDRKSVV